MNIISNSKLIDFRFAKRKMVQSMYILIKALHYFETAHEFEVERTKPLSREKTVIDNIVEHIAKQK